jgi:hypothetical protein
MFSGEPVEADHKTYTIIVTATDLNSQTEVNTFNIIVNDEPSV